ncbi:hypothetical protein EJ04DRAFT_261187 [Polyplosphaeria fusca]|uniref:Large ribosomal subunit protein uL23m n=1 Tax=Polyplosphaeria fusca TaxID=682080 RepID=A0A9P4RAK7_9PLEO|nr:hypothetical protein EJ04DRAFT_261187 [Polyplosphaeria fusca]
MPRYVPQSLLKYRETVKALNQEKIIDFGRKKIFLPTFTIALLRGKGLNPYQARFLVPLNFSKFDLRDYLYHLYNLKVFNIRSWVRQMPVRATTAQPGKLFREESKKYMTVEMEHPFVWPEKPRSFEPWGKSEKSKIEALSVEENVTSLNFRKQYRERLQTDASKILSAVASNRRIQGARKEETTIVADEGIGSEQETPQKGSRKKLPKMRRFDDPGYKIKI